MKLFNFFKKKTNLIILILSIISFTMLFEVFVQRYKFEAIYKDNIKDIVFMKQSFSWKDAREIESNYYDMMISIFATFSYKYDMKYKKAMNKEQQIDYINKNFIYAQALGMGLYDVPIIHQLETAFNPYAEGDYSERGIGQIKWNTAIFAKSLLNYLPDNYKRLLDFDLKSPNDLFDPIISLKITYTLLYWFRKDYKGRPEWYISVYHWGGFLSRHFDNGNGDIPSKFILNGIEYNVMKYFYSWKSIKEAYENNMLEPCKEIVEKWQAYQKRLCKEEITYRNTRRIIKNLRKQLIEKKEIEKELNDKYDDIEKQLKKAEIQLKQISEEAKSGKGKTALRKVKDVIKGLLKSL